MNKFLRFLGYIGVHLFVVLEIYILALFISSPVMFIIISIMDAIHRIPVILEGRYLIVWLLVSLVLWLPMYLYVEVKGKLKAGGKKNETNKVK